MLFRETNHSDRQGERIKVRLYNSWAYFFDLLGQGPTFLHIEFIPMTLNFDALTLA